MYLKHMTGRKEQRGTIDEIDGLGRSAGRAARQRGQRLAPLVRVATNAPEEGTMNRKTVWVAAAATVMVAAGVVAIASVRNNPSAQTTPVTEPAPQQSTTSSASTETTTTTELTETTEVASTSPAASTETPTTVQPPGELALEHAAIWPGVDVVFETPEDAASDFVTVVLGVEPVLGEFRQLDPRSGEIEIRSDADSPPGTTSPRALLHLAQLRPTDGWYVVRATSDGASISDPVGGDDVSPAPLTIAGEGRGFESTLNVRAFIAGAEISDLDLVIAAGGAFGQTEPYSATVDLSEASPGDVITILVRGDTGLSEDPGEFAAVAVVIAS